MKKSKDSLYAISNTDRVFTIQSDFTFEESIAPIKSFQDMDIFENVTIWASRDGNLVF